MGSDEEKNNLETKPKINTKKELDLLETSIKVIQALAIVVGIFFTYLEFKRYNTERIEREKERNEQTAKEIRMHFYQLQLDFYAEASEAAATLATEEIGSEDYQSARKKFMRLFWGRLAIVEEKTVEAQMMVFKSLLDEYEKPESKVQREELEQASLNLAHSASKYTINVWVDSGERANYNNR